MASRGDKRAFERIFKEYHQELYRYCLAILGSPGDAEDALQMTMAAALRSLPGEEREIALKPWLYRVAHNESISILRKRQPESPDDKLPEALAPSAASESEQRERLRSLIGDLNSLPERQRGALVMRELSGLGYEEIANALGCTSAAARQTVYEARQALQIRSEGREMECEPIRQALSDGDRRRLRGRGVRAHLRSCPSCADFEAAIGIRRRELAAICPPLPVAAAGGMLTALLAGGSSSGGVGAAAGLGGGGAALAGGASAGAASLAGGSGVALKAASLAAVAVIGAGAADVTGVVDLPGPLHIGSRGDTTGNDSRGAERGAAPTAGQPASAGHARSGSEGQSGGNPALNEPGARAGGEGSFGRADKARGEKGQGSAKADHSGTGTQGTGGGTAGGESSGSGSGRPSNPGSQGQGQSQGGKPAIPPGQAAKAESGPGKSAAAPGQNKPPGSSAGVGVPAAGGSNGPGASGGTLPGKSKGVGVPGGGKKK